MSRTRMKSHINVFHVCRLVICVSLFRVLCECLRVVLKYLPYWNSSGNICWGNILYRIIMWFNPARTVSFSFILCQWWVKSRNPYNCIGVRRHIDLNSDGRFASLQSLVSFCHSHTQSQLVYSTGNTAEVSTCSCYLSVAIVNILSVITNAKQFAVFSSVSYENINSFIAEVVELNNA